MNPINQETPAQSAEAEAKAKEAQRAEQARINGAKSHGPTTIAGKAISSQNALKHGFSAKINILIDPDDSDAWHIHLAAYHDGYRPTNYIETEFVDQLASIKWRQSRLVGIETSLIDLQLSLQQQKVDEHFPLEEGNPRLHLALAWQALARKPLPRLLPADPNEPPDPTLPPDGLDIESIELVRRYQVSLDRQFRNTLLDFRQYRKDFAPSQEIAKPAVQAPTAPEPNEPSSPAFELPQAPNQWTVTSIERPKTQKPEPRPDPIHEKDVAA